MTPESENETKLAAGLAPLPRNAVGTPAGCCDALGRYKLDSVPLLVLKYPPTRLDKNQGQASRIH
eukprot:scaffold21551_cov44-Prasinocladus_malaysianus.AAC.2